MDHGEPVLPEGLLEQRDPGHEQHLDQEQDRREEAGEPAERGQPGVPRAEVGEAAAGGPPERDEGEGDDEQRLGGGPHAAVPDGGCPGPGEGVAGGAVGERGHVTGPPRTEPDLLFVS